MAYEKKDNTLFLFKNDKKETDKHPDLTGQGQVAGKEYWLSAWKNVSKAGKGYFKVSLELKDSISKPNGEAKSMEEDLLDFPS